jgi:hypothetical protein
MFPIGPAAGKGEVMGTAARTGRVSDSSIKARIASPTSLCTDKVKREEGRRIIG